MRKDLSWNDAHRWHRRQGRRAIAGAIAVVVVGTVVSSLFAVAWQRSATDSVQTRFDSLVNRQEDVLRETVHRYIQVLAVTRGFIAATDDLNDRRFSLFTESLQLEERAASLESLMYIEPGSGDLVYPVVLVAPATARTGLVGKDLATDPPARAALESVGDSGGIAFTPPSLDPWARPRMLLVAPVDRGGEFVGWLGASLDPAAFSVEALTGLPDGARVSLAWGKAGGTVIGVAGPDAPALADFRRQEQVQVADSSWTMGYVLTEAFAPSAASFPWVVFGLGLVPVAVTALILFFLGRSRMQALLLAERLGRNLAASEARARVVMDHAFEAILTADDRGTIESANPAAANLFGWDVEELVGHKLASVLPSLEVPDGPEGLAGVVWGSKERMLNAHRKVGSVIPVDVSLAPTTIDERSLFILIARDATLRKQQEEQLTHQATHDGLTELANRKLFEELLIRATFRSDRAGSPMAVLFVDLDGFKDVNDEFGHQAGDRVLSEMARRLESVVRPGDVVARLGGDEFAVLCENLTDPLDAEKIAQRIVEVVKRPVAVASGSAGVSASVGVAVSQGGEGATSLVERADRAMYEMKHDGKAGYRLAS